MLKHYVLAGALCLAGTTGATAAPLHISLTGYCNQFTITLDGFAVYGKRAGCGDHEVEGGTNADISGVPYIITNDKEKKNPLLYTWYFTPPVKKAGSWYLYASNGKSETEINSGTYTVGPFPEVLSTKSAILK